MTLQGEERTNLLHFWNHSQVGGLLNLHGLDHFASLFVFPSLRVEGPESEIGVRVGRELGNQVFEHTLPLFLPVFDSL